MDKTSLACLRLPRRLLPRLGQHQVKQVCQPLLLKVQRQAVNNARIIQRAAAVMVARQQQVSLQRKVSLAAKH